MKEFGAIKTEDEGKMFVSNVGNQLSSDALSYPGITVSILSHISSLLCQITRLI